MHKAPWEQEHYSFSGPGVAISCKVDYDKERECYLAVGSSGHRGTADNSHAAALNEDLAWREDLSAPIKPTRPERVCLECGGEIPETMTRRSRFCCVLHRTRWSNRRGHRKRAGLDPDFKGDYRRAA